MSADRLADRPVLAAADASGFIQRYFQRFDTVKAYQDNVIEGAERKGYAETMRGRRRYLPEVNSHLFAVRSAAIRQIINAPIQGSASDIVKIAMIRVAEFLKREAPNVRMLLQVHDELVLEGTEADLIRIADKLA